MMLTLGLGASALVMTPASSPFTCDVKTTTVQMSVSRRAVLAGTLSAAVPLSASAGFADLFTDKKKLDEEEAVIKALDSTLQKERKLAFSEELEIGRTNDAVLEALRKGDTKLTKELQTKIRDLEAQYASEEKKILALQDEEEKESKEEKALLAKVKADEKEELKEETKEIIEAEEAATKAEIGGDNANVVGKYLK